jgi:hypothetical protein
MAAGFGALLTKDQINQNIGRLAVSLRDTFADVAQFSAWHAGVGGAGLEATYGFTAGDAAIIGSAITDFKQLEQIYLGLAALASAKDFRAFSDDVEGLR